MYSVSSAKHYNNGFNYDTIDRLYEHDEKPNVRLKPDW